MCAPVFATTEEVLSAYIIYIICGSNAIEIAKIIHRGNFKTARTYKLLVVAFHSVSLAAIAEVREVWSELAVCCASVEGSNSISQSSAPVTVVLLLAADVISVFERLNIVAVSEDSVDVYSYAISCIAPQLGSVVPVLLIELLCTCNDSLYVSLHLIGQERVFLSICQSVVELLEALIVVNLCYVDAAVIEATAPVLLDVCGNNVLAHIEVTGRDVNLYRVLAVGPAAILLKQVAVYVSPICIIVADVQLIFKAIVNLVELEVTTNPVIGVVAARPDALLLGHVACAADGHHLVVPHRVVEVG